MGGGECSALAPPLVLPHPGHSWGWGLPGWGALGVELDRVGPGRGRVSSDSAPGRLIGRWGHGCDWEGNGVGLGVGRGVHDPTSQPHLEGGVWLEWEG